MAPRTLKQGGEVDSERPARVILGARAGRRPRRTMTQPTLDAERVTLVPAVLADLGRETGAVAQEFEKDLNTRILKRLKEAGY